MRLRKRLVSVDRELPQPRIRADYDAAGFFYLSTPIIEFRGFGSEPPSGLSKRKQRIRISLPVSPFLFFKRQLLRMLADTRLLNQ
jgi:hypothetical protein